MKRTFNFDKGKEYELKEVVVNANLPLEWSWDRGVCPNCNKEITVVKNYTIDRIEILEEPGGETVFLGFTKELIGEKPFTLRLPDKTFCKEKDMSADIKAKSIYLKEKDK